ncbi:MAG: PsiF family protein [Casimicrobiaceae bacterium]
MSGEEQAAKSKMSTCNTQAKGMKGDEHKKFMSDCMKKAA